MTYKSLVYLFTSLLLAPFSLQGSENGGWRPPGVAVMEIDGDGTLTDVLSGRRPVSPELADFEPGREPGRQAWRVGPEPLIHAGPDDFDPAQGSLSLWYRPQSDCRDDVYRRFFTMRTEGGGSVSLLKSGSGGNNGLFIVVMDDEGRRHDAYAVPGDGYEWTGGDWRHIAASWDAAAGALQLFFDGRLAAFKNVGPFALTGTIRDVAVGARFDGEETSGGTLGEFRLYQEVATARPLARALNSSGPERLPGNAIDSDRGDGSVWSGRGAPNWLEIVLPEAIELARVVLYPGIRSQIGFPSTDGSPAVFKIQGFQDGKWEDLSEPRAVLPAEVRPHDGVLVDIQPARVRRFRIYVTSLHDRGFRVHSPSEPIVPPENRSVHIREVEWFDRAQVESTRWDASALGEKVNEALATWRAALEAAGDFPPAVAIMREYGEMLAVLEEEASLLLPEDQIGWRALHGRWSRIEKWLAPWKNLVMAAASGAEIPTPMEAAWPAPGPEVGRLRLEVDPGQGSRESYPASVPLDLRILEAWWRTEIDPYTIQVMEVGPNGRPVRVNADLEGFDRYLCPVRFERITPARGHLQWTMRNRNSTRFVARFLPRPDSPPDLGGVTLGNGDGFYYNEVRITHFPWNIFSSDFVDWDGDGRKDLICGRWTDYIHFWRNIGTAEEPLFHSREHFLVHDLWDNPLICNPAHPALARSVAYPVDFEGNGLMDLFIDRYYGNRPRFHRRLDRPGFPVMDTAKVPVGLQRGTRAFGDLTGNGRADVLVVLSDRTSDRFVYQPGLGLDENGAPRFGAPVDLNIQVPRSPGGGTGSRRLVPSLADVTGNGLLDLTVTSPPFVYFFENRGSPSKPVFTRRRRLSYEGGDVDVDLRFPSVQWYDYNNNGTLDLFRANGVQVYLNKGRRGSIDLGELIRPPLKEQRMMPRSNLRGYAMVDWDGSGLTDHALPDGWCHDFWVSRRRPDGLFEPPERVDVDPEKNDWYGCTDRGEYASLYAQLRLVDWTGNGHLDAFINSTHTWRFGYLAYYENRGDGTFGPEVKIRTGGACDYVVFEEGASGLGARIDNKTFLNYLSYPTAGRFDPSAGRVRFWVRPLWDADNGETHYFFYNAPAPTARGIHYETLSRYYTGLTPDLEIPPPFAIYKTPEGTLRFQAGGPAIESTRLNWKKGGSYRVEAAWNEQGLALAVDGRVVARSRETVPPVPSGQRMHIGSKAWMGMQREREYPGRWSSHPTDFSFPAMAVLDDFEVYGPEDDLLFSLRFEGHADSEQGDSGDRLRVGYRCSPGFGDLTGNGMPDMVMMLGDGRRGPGSAPEHREWGYGKLYLYPNTGAPGSPALGEPILLRHANGEPFRSHIRTQINLVDWNGNGLLDLILSTENHEDAIHNRAVDFFENVGTADRPVFGSRQPMHRLNELMQPHHDVKLVAVDLTGNGREDLVTSTDPGTRIYFRSFLEEDPVEVTFGVK